MQIQPLNGIGVHVKAKNPQFKAGYPVIHWVAETNGSWAPTVTYDLTKKLQGTLIRILNGSKKNLTNAEKKVREYLSRCDIDYRRLPESRSFYEKRGGFINGKFEPISYMITGEDVDIFEQTFGKPMGNALRTAPFVNGRYNSAELHQAKSNYRNNGKNFANAKSRKLYDANGVAYSLHTKFQAIRSKTGKLKGYNIIEVKFCPDTGENNPFVRLGYIKE